MVKIKGEGWVGSLDLTNGQAEGRINGYSWLLKLKPDRWSFEIAEDQSIESEALPLVGFGCSGWLSESKRENEPSECVVTEYLEQKFSEFAESKLKFYPSVSCNCSD